MRQTDREHRETVSSERDRGYHHQRRPEPRDLDELDQAVERCDHACLLTEGRELREPAVEAEPHADRAERRRPGDADDGRVSPPARVAEQDRELGDHADHDRDRDLAEHRRHEHLLVVAVEVADDLERVGVELRR